MATTKLLRDQRGAAAVEFAFLLPVLIVILLAITEFGRLYWARSTMQMAINEAARFAMLDPTASGPEIEDYALDSAFGLNPSRVSFTADLSEIGFVTIVGTYNFELIAGPFFSDPIDLESRTRVPRS